MNHLFEINDNPDLNGPTKNVQIKQLYGLHIIFYKGSLKKGLKENFCNKLWYGLYGYGLRSFYCNEIVDASILVNVVQLFKSQRQEILSRKDPHLNWNSMYNIYDCKNKYFTSSCLFFKYTQLCHNYIATFPDL